MSFFIKFDYEPWTFFDWNKPSASANAQECLNQDKTQLLAKRMHDAWQVARSNMQKAQKAQKRQTDKKHQNIDFNKGDMI